MSERRRVPLHVITGFLGAGKTTLINHLLRSPELGHTLVIVNEWGEVGLDHLLYETIADEVILIASGCVCCKLRGDLVDALQDVLARRDAGALPPFERILLETSGLADPGPVLHALIATPLLSYRCYLDGVTTLVDAVNGAATLSRFSEARRQVAFADRLALTKSDLVAERAALRVLRAALFAISPGAPIFDVAEGEFGARDFLRPSLPSVMRNPPGRIAAHSGSLRARSFSCRQLIDAPALARFLALLEALLGPRLLRVKGLVATKDAPDQPLLIEGAQHVFAPLRRLKAWPDASRETRLVVIADAIEPDAIESLWLALTGVPQIDRPDLIALGENPLAPAHGGFLE